MKKYIFLIVSLFSINTAFSVPLVGSMDQSAANAQGQYQPMDMGYAGFNSLGMTQEAWLDPLQNLGEGQSKPAYSKYYWYKDLVLPIRLRESMITLVNFPEWEMIESVQFGNKNAFYGQIVGPNTVLLWTEGEVGVDTNVVMFGRSGNKYVFYIKSEGVDTERLTNAIIDIEIPEDGSNNSSGGGVSGGVSSGGSSLGGIKTATRRFQKQDWLKEIPFNPDQLKFDMEVYVPNPQDVVIAPERVWRDDVFTYIDLGEKALTMVQRPIVTQIVERSEMPVGFRTKGPNNRLIVVEGIGDFVMRNGKRIICLKIRRDDAMGSQGYSSYEDTEMFANEWDVPPPLPNFGAGQNGAAGAMNGAGGYGNQDTPLQGYGQYATGANGSSNSTMQNGAGFASGGRGSKGGDSGAFAIVDEFYQNAYTQNSLNGNISVQLGTGDDIEKMEDLWLDLSLKYPEILGEYDPFFSVDAPADGEGKELFHLRINPIQTLEQGDRLCSQLGRNGVFCSVVRTQ